MVLVEAAGAPASPRLQRKLRTNGVQALRTCDRQPTCATWTICPPERVLARITGELFRSAPWRTN